ncbi:hypothetical protein IAR50_003050 [Cryptococcus sp. DSM 104548]
MTEYWVSKKQYWCKFCNIYIRDDAPSRRQHESGLKHQGNKERFIRDLYRGGEKAKKEQAEEAREMARIEAAASAAHAQDTASGYSKAFSSTPSSSTAAPAPASKPRNKPTDKWSNYSTAAQLGFVAEEDAKKTAYEIELELKGQAGEVGQWEEVALPPPAPVAEATEVIAGAKRPREEDEEGEGWKFEHKGKKPVFDPYDDDWDPSFLKSLKVKKKEGASSKDAKVEEERARVKEEKEAAEIEERGLKREGWSGKLEWKSVKEENGTVKVEVKEEGKEADVRPGFVKLESVNASTPVPVQESTVKSELQVESAPALEPAPAPGGGMFKKRRPPPSNRKK